MKFYCFNISVNSLGEVFRHIYAGPVELGFLDAICVDYVKRNSHFLIYFVAHILLTLLT